MLKYIKLKNFMSHSETEICLSEGLNVIIGPNNCGKSALIHALQILCRNQKGTDYVRKHNTESTEVVVETAEGDVFKWIRSEKGKKETVFYEINGIPHHRLNGNIPAEVDSLLKLPLIEPGEGHKPFEIHFAEQKDPIFLLDESGSKAALFFASSSDAGKLLEMQKMHQLKIKEAKRTFKELEIKLDNINTDLEVLSPIDILFNVITCQQKEFFLIQILEDFIDLLFTQIDALRKISRQKEYDSKLLKIYDDFASPPILNDTTSLERHVKNLSELKRREKSSSSFKDILIKLCSPPDIDININNLSEQIQTANFLEKKVTLYKAVVKSLRFLKVIPTLLCTKELTSELKELKHIYSKLNSIRRISSVLNTLTIPTEIDQDSIETLKGQIHQLINIQKSIDDQFDIKKELNDEISNLKADIKEWISEHPTCPLCMSQLNFERVIHGDDYD